jgi:hypothetical protein
VGRSEERRARKEKIIKRRVTSKTGGRGDGRGDNNKKGGISRVMRGMDEKTVQRRFKDFRLRGGEERRARKEKIIKRRVTSKTGGRGDGGEDNNKKGG